MGLEVLQVFVKGILDITALGATPATAAVMYTQDQQYHQNLHVKHQQLQMRHQYH